MTAPVARRAAGLALLGLAWGGVACPAQAPGDALSSGRGPGEEVVFRSEPRGPALAGTITEPAGEGPVPGAVLLGVAGPNDRNLTLPGGLEPFRVLAGYLADRGIASLRADDRGVGGSEGDFFQADLDALVGDALAGVELLASRPGIDRERVGLVSVSEGALVAAAAARSGRVAFVVLLAGPGERGVEVIAARGEERLRRAGAGEERIRSFRSRLEELARLVEDPPRDVRAELRALQERGPLLPPYGFVPSDPERRIDLVLSPWYRTQLTADPRPALKEIRVPVLALTGSRDRINLPSRSLSGIQRALAHGRTSDYTVGQLPGLNHFMQPARTGGPAEVADLEVAFAPLALRTIADWIEPRLGAEPSAPREPVR